MASTPPTNTPFLSYPSPDDPPSLPSSSTQEIRKTLLKDRLYVGNLHPTVDEYTLLTLFSKYGTITSLDFLFHKSGPSRGKPRGFAFVEFAEQAPAQKALQSLNEKLLRGRKLVVTYAHQAPPDPYSSSSASGIGIGVDRHGGGAGRYRKGMMDSGKPTTLSLLKSGRGDGPNPRDKIALMEAKLRQMESSSPIPSSSTRLSTSASGSGSISTPMAAHPSLPPKPPPPSSTPTSSASQPHLDQSNTTSGPTLKHRQNQKQKQKEGHSHQPLPSLPILPASHPRSRSSSDFASSLSSSYSPSILPAVASGTMTTPPSIQTGNTTTNKDASSLGGDIKPTLMPTLRGAGSTKSGVPGQGRSLFGLAGVKIVRRDH